MRLSLFFNDLRLHPHWGFRLLSTLCACYGHLMACALSLQMMKLAVSYRRKALTFVSSVGVAGPLGIKEVVHENTLGTELATEFPASGGYAYG